MEASLICLNDTSAVLWIRWNQSQSLHRKVKSVHWLHQSPIELTDRKLSRPLNIRLHGEPGLLKGTLFSLISLIRLTANGKFIFSRHSRIQGRLLTYLPKLGAETLYTHPNEPKEINLMHHSAPLYLYLSFTSWSATPSHEGPRAKLALLALSQFGH